jgi:ABC-type nitrate/sulfonate/bicarbonate transport system substrate-binding protein
VILPNAVPARIGILRLTDSAPVLIAAEDGLFAEQGIAVEISLEPSWSNLADKLTYGLLDAAVMLPPLALAMVLGLRGVPAPLVVPMGVSLGGNAVVVSREAAEAAGRAGNALERARRLVGWMRAQPAPPRFAVVHLYSTHNLLLRYWVAAGGGDPDRDMRIVIVPPQHVVHALAERRIAGFCAGAPWGDAADEQGAGEVLLGTSAIWAAHPEKCLVLTERWLGMHTEAAAGLMRALLQAGRICAEGSQAERIAGVLAAAGYGASRRAITAALTGGPGRERVFFHAGAAWFPWRSQALWFLHQMRRWGWVGRDVDLGAIARQVYRPDLLAPAARAEGLPWPATDRKPEGGHVEPWLLAATPEPLRMLPDQLCDAAPRAHELGTTSRKQPTWRSVEC